MKFVFSPDVILFGLLGSKHLLTNEFFKQSVVCFSRCHSIHGYVTLPATPSVSCVQTLGRTASAGFMKRYVV